MLDRARASFVRVDADTRRQDMIDACAKVLAEKGVDGCSVRTVCASAGVSPGLLRHYFAGIDDLIAATYAHVGERVSTALALAVADAGGTRRGKLNAYVAASFKAPITDAELLSTWLAFWSLVKTDHEIARLHGSIYDDYRRGLEDLLSECGIGPAELRLAAVAITALVDGLWLELCLDPKTFSPEEAQRIALRWVDTLIRQPRF
jgi:TetR/AcrR family transcriptional regulator, transcriptional repressor of bet genes